MEIALMVAPTCRNWYEASPNCSPEIETKRSKRPFTCIQPHFLPLRTKEILRHGYHRLLVLFSPVPPCPLPSLPFPIQSLHTPLSRLLLLNRTSHLPLPRRTPRPPPRPLRLLCHARFPAQLLVGIDHVCLLGRHFLALDDSEARSCRGVGSGGRGRCGCCCGCSAGDTGCYGDAVVGLLGFGSV